MYTIYPDTVDDDDLDFEYIDSKESRDGDDDDILYYNPDSEPIEAESVFNRRERLDVKKPGPFYANSPNNFYIDKIPEDVDDVDLDDDLGQTEYEYPMSQEEPRHKKGYDLGNGHLLRKRAFSGLGSGNLLRSMDGLGEGHLLRSMDSLGGGHLLRAMDSLGDGNLLRAIGGLGKGHLLRGMEGLGNGHLLRAMDGLGDGQLLRAIDSLGDGHLLRSMDSLGRGHLLRSMGLGGGHLLRSMGSQD